MNYCIKWKLFVKTYLIIRKSGNTITEKCFIHFSLPLKSSPYLLKDLSVDSRVLQCAALLFCKISFVFVENLSLKEIAFKT